MGMELKSTSVSWRLAFMPIDRENKKVPTITYVSIILFPVASSICIVSIIS